MGRHKQIEVAIAQTNNIKSDVEEMLPPSGKNMLKKTMPAYFILKTTSSEHLEKLVRNAIDMDCKPIGGVAVSKDNLTFDELGKPVYCYFQAMIRE